MATTIFDGLRNTKKYILNNYRIKKIGKKFLMTTDTGAWVALSKEEYDKLIRYELDPDAFQYLEQKGIILTNQNIQSVLADHYKRTLFLRNGSNLHILIPTLRCNHKCVYCHSAAATANAKENDMDGKTAEKMLQFIFQTPSKKITIEFQGGDGALNFEIVKKIILRAKEINKEHNKTVKFSFVTNLTAVTDEMIDFLKEEHINICTSLDGPEELHDLNRPMEDGRKSYATVIEMIKKLSAMGMKPGALMVTTKNSLTRYKEIIDEYVNLGLNNIQIKPLNKMGFASNCWDSIGFDADEFIDFWKNSVDYIIEINKKGTLVRERFVTLIMQKIAYKYDPGFLDFRTPCGAVIGQLAYNFNGDIHCCDEGRSDELFKLGNVKTDKYFDVIQKKESQQLISTSMNENYVCDNCAYKPYCGLCPVMSYHEEGNIIPKIPINTKCKIHKAQFDYVFDKILNDEEIRKIFLSWIETKNKPKHEHGE